MNKKGVTLIEMIGVLAILTIVLFAAIPNIISAIKKANNSKFTNIENILKNNMELYVQDKKEDLFADGSINGGFMLGFSDLLSANQDIKINNCSVNKLLVDRTSTCISDCEGEEPLYSHKFNYTVCISCPNGNRQYISNYAGCDMEGSHTLTINPNGGMFENSSNSTTSLIMPEGSRYIENPTDDKLIFNGWKVEGEGSSLQDNVFVMGTENATLTARWILNNSMTYTLTIDPNGGSWEGTTNLTTLTINGDESQDISTPTKEGSLFDGWTLEGAGSIYRDGQFTMGTENATLTAKWILLSDLTRTYSYTNGVQEYDVLATGWYLMETWGAQGGGNVIDKIALGGYSKGIIHAEAGEKYYVVVGGQGTYQTSGEISGGYNGGGSALGFSDNNCGSGGGATDIRFENNTLIDRIMVAGGGGGIVTLTSNSAYGHGGGLLANSAVGVLSSTSYTAYGGSQLDGGYGSTASMAGSFGQGANGGTTYRAGGGGGYYGGGIAQYLGSGGSSFISGYAGSGAVSSNGSNLRNPKHYSNKYFLKGEMQSGVNSNDGRAKITYLGTTDLPRINTDLDDVKYIKDCATRNVADSVKRWMEIQAIYKGNNVAKGKTPYMEDGGTVSVIEAVTDGWIGSVLSDGNDTYSNSNCIVINLGSEYDLDEIAVWHSWSDKFKTVSGRELYVSNDGTNWKKIGYTNADDIETSQGKRVNPY